MTDNNPVTDPALAVPPELDPCECCEGLTERTPLLVNNRAGLSAIAYRAGTYNSFLQTLLTRLTDSGNPVLRGLTTRDSHDFTIALLDAWATVGDVITFYQERIANESYLRTATERASLIYLARLIGYKLRPGLAAETTLAFSMEDAPGAPDRAVLSKGTQVQSVPEQGQDPQTFETVEQIEARPAWNTLHPRRSQRFKLKNLTSGMSASERKETLLLDGQVTNLKAGDVLLHPVEGGGTSFGVVLSVTPVVAAPPAIPTNPMQLPSSRPEPPKNITIVQIRLPDFSAGKRWPAGNAVIDALSADQTPLPELSSLAESILNALPSNCRMSADDLEAQATVEGWKVQDLFDNILAAQKSAPRVWVLKTRAAIFGHNAPTFSSLPAVLTQKQLTYTDQGVAVGVDGPYKGLDNKWVDNHDLGHYPGGQVARGAFNVQVPLDNQYSGVQAGSVVLFRNGETWGIFPVAQVSDRSLSLFTLTGKVSVIEVTLGVENDLAAFNIRATGAFGEPAPLTLARKPFDDETVSGSTIDLEGLVQGLTAGQRIILTGEVYGTRGVYTSEAAQLARVEYDFSDEPYTLLTLSGTLANTFVRQTVTINANAARATHGESKAEVMGSGDGSQAYQRFALKQPPLTTLSAQTPEGSQSTLEVRVNGLLWNEVPYLYGHLPGERIYTTRQEDDGTTTVMFGDGQTGARLPSGRENIRADYRRGTGTAGLLKKDQISLLMTRPQGVRNASNPIPSAGGQDPDSIGQIRQNAPLPILTLDRIVSLRDYEDFARAFSGIAKALATWTWDGQSRGVFVTIAGPEGRAIEDDSSVRINLLAAMRSSGDPYAHLRVKTFRPAFFRLSARIKCLPENKGRESDVLTAVATRLRAAFSFEARAFGQPVWASEVIALIQDTPGVMAATLDKLYRSKDTPAPNPRLDAGAPTAGDLMGVQAAELLMIDPAPLDLSVMP